MLPNPIYVNAASQRNHHQRSPHHIQNPNNSVVTRPGTAPVGAVVSGIPTSAVGAVPLSRPLPQQRHIARPPVGVVGARLPPPYQSPSPLLLPPAFHLRASAAQAPARFAAAASIYDYYNDSFRRSPRGRSFVTTFMMDRGNAFACMKYTLILCNVFGFILAIFNALFGIGYPTEKWPGGYTGGQMAIFSIFVMAFTTIGYCGAQHHKGYLLIVYGIIIFFLLIGIVAIIFIYNDALAEFMYNGYIISFAVIIFFLMLFAFFISYKISEHHSNKYLSTIIPTAQQRSQQMAISGGGGGGGHSGGGGSASAGGGGGMNTCGDGRRNQGQFGGSASHHQMGHGHPSAPCPVPGCNYGKIISN